MSDPIKAGDLVMVVKCHCELTAGALGTVFVVTKVKTVRVHCHCGAVLVDTPAAYNGQMNYGLPAAEPLHYLKRIPPIEELDDVKQDEELTA